MARKRVKPQHLAEARVKDAMQLRIAAGSAVLYRGVLRRDYEALAQAYRETGEVVESAVKESDMAKALATNWERTAKAAGGRTLMQLTSKKRYHCAVHTKGIMQDLLARELVGYGKRWLGKKILQVSTTTIDQVRGIAQRFDGEDINTIANQISTLGAALSGYRSMTIARTETHSIANWSSDEVAKATGDNLGKQWAATIDDRTRDDHTDADGEIVKMGAMFDVGGEQLEYPGDPNGSPENVIQCRCQALYIDLDYQ